MSKFFNLKLLPKQNTNNKFSSTKALFYKAIYKAKYEKMRILTPFRRHPAVYYEASKQRMESIK